MTKKKDQVNREVKGFKALKESLVLLPAHIITIILIPIVLAIAAALISPISHYIEKVVYVNMTKFFNASVMKIVSITDSGTITKFQIIPGIDEMENPFLIEEIDKYDNKTGILETVIEISEPSEVEITAQVSGVYRTKAPEALKGMLFAKIKINGIEEMLGFEQIPVNEKIKPGYPFTLERQLIYKKALTTGKYEIKVIGLYWGRLETPKIVMNYTVRRAGIAQTRGLAGTESEAAKSHKRTAQEREEYTRRINLNRTQPSRVSIDPQIEFDIPNPGRRSGESTGCSEPGKR